MLQCTTRRAPACACAVDDVLHALHVDGAVRAVGLPGFPIGRGDVVDDVDALAGRRDRGGIGQVASDDLDARLAQGGDFGPAEASRPDQAAHRARLGARR